MSCSTGVRSTADRDYEALERLRRMRAAVAAGSLAAALSLVAVALSMAASPALAQQPAPTAPVAIDGPAAIPSPSGLGLSVSRDGTGGLVYLRQTDGGTHVFVSLLQDGSFRAPAQVDTGLAGASSQPVIAAGEDGLLLIGFINGGELYVVGRTSTAAQLGSPAGIAGGAANPAISITDFGKAYLAFAVADGSGSDVRTAYYYNGRWALESPPLNASPADNSGTGAGAPAVSAAGDGVAIVAWGEQGHIFSRRVWATTPSLVVEQADGAPSGCTELSSDSPAVGTGGDSSYAQVAFHEVVSCNGQQQPRVLANRLHGSVYDGLEAADGLAGSSGGGASDPQIAMTEYGHGWITSVRSGGGDVFATAMGDQGAIGGTIKVNGLSGAAPPDPVAATAGLYSTLIAWQQSPGSAGIPEVRVRYAPDGSALGSELVVSTPGRGPTDAGDGLSASGDVAGDAAAAWLQGTPGATWVMAEQMYQGPGPIFVAKALRYVNTSNPILQWSAARELWGPMTYSVDVDGTQVAQTSSAAVRVSSTVPDGSHSWQVTGANPAGQSTESGTGTVFVDTLPPTATMTLYGHPIVGTMLHVYAAYADLPPAGEPAADASGVANVVIRWGDGTTVPLGVGSHRAYHAYVHPGQYVISLLVTDRAGNATRQVIPVIVKPRPKPKPKPTHHPAKPGTKPKGKAG